MKDKRTNLDDRMKPSKNANFSEELDKEPCSKIDSLILAYSNQESIVKVLGTKVGDIRENHKVCLAE